MCGTQDSLSMNTISTLSDFHGIHPYGESLSPTELEDTDRQGDNDQALRPRQPSRLSPTDKPNNNHHQMPNLSGL